jgi:hypothetical protein
MFPAPEFLSDLLILIVVFTIFVVGSVRWKPRIWLHDFPADIQALAPPETAEEKRLTMLVAIPFISLLVALPVLLSWDLKVLWGTGFNFFTAWFYTYALFLGINLWDLVVLDWFGLTLVDPQNPPFPEAAGAAGWRNYAFHFYAFLRGCIMGLVISAVQAGIVTLVA